ncbi:UDP-glucose dehydrogenase family protein [Anoxybacteroides rupiense]|uniref:UDP-glucose 6-dehydrogenase n=1 Tax=Anoxybacteroides rupiense TaxID=311460 RepID=A0ABD5IXH7_9BACL|nr:UDP-glucose/GDP-mannose dehydrogenase family protein [Anoxybacillus rupiensis]MBB3909111.1 UDPglucose 6-dehydrogenase [Anoxybacillus rupiensis]MED5053055.1 UDP-glucose/GDP-mannose dehydrogenase family protein [Anoxybacillus rupiensis]
MKITVTGTGYVGLVTGVCLAEIGHDVICYDIDEPKVQMMKQGISPIYEPGLDELMRKNMEQGRLFFTADEEMAYGQADIIYIAVGTPEKEDGSADLTYVEEAALAISRYVRKRAIVVIKSTVPVGTNDRIQRMIHEHKAAEADITVVSNPEFLREGSAIYDMFHGDRIVIGANDPEAATVIADINKPFGIPIIHTDIRSAEMIKYAANAFLATKISFINEIANICEKVGANIDDVAYGIGQDHRIGPHFLKAGIGYGGSCFPKDTKALVQLAGNLQYQFDLLEAVIHVNNKQQLLLYTKAKELFGSLAGKKVAVLGLSFKPNTDDIREAASLVFIHQLLGDQAQVTVYDPIAMEKAKAILGDQVVYASSAAEALCGQEIAFIATEWEEIKALPFSLYVEQMKEPVIFDGRNCYDIKEAERFPLTYISIGRRPIVQAPSMEGSRR